MNKPQRKQEERSQETRDSILQACRTVFSQKGILGASLKDIEAQSGMPRALIYYHFGSLENIITVITTQNLERARTVIREKIELANLDNDYSASHLRQMVLSLLKLVDEITLGPGRAMSIHVWSVALVKEEVRAMLEKLFGDIRHDLVTALELHSNKLGAKDRRHREVAVSLFSLVIPAYIVQRLFSGTEALEPEAFLEAYETLFDALKGS